MKTQCPLVVSTRTLPSPSVRTCTAEMRAGCLTKYLLLWMFFRSSCFKLYAVTGIFPMPCMQYTTPDAAVWTQDQDIRSCKGRYWCSVDCCAKMDARNVFDVAWNVLFDFKKYTSSWTDSRPCVYFSTKETFILIFPEYDELCLVEECYILILTLTLNLMLSLSPGELHINWKSRDSRRVYQHHKHVYPRDKLCLVE